MSIIKLDKNYSIESDANNFTLRFEMKIEKTVKKELKEVTSRDEWHYPKMQYALNRYLQECIKPCESASEIINKLNEIEKTIIQLLK